MNNTIVVSALSLSLLAAPLAQAATSHEKAYVEQYRGRSDIPTPISVVSPEIRRQYAGTTVKLEFVVDESGTPEDITVLSGGDAQCNRDVVAAIEQWRFTPAHDADGKPVARRVSLPVEIVDGDFGAPLFAAD